MSADAMPEADRRGDLPHPRETYDLIGQDDAQTSVLEALQSGKIPHAWILGGSEGIGKATLAYRFARTALKHGEDLGDVTALDLAPDDPVSRQIEAGSHPDLLVLRRPVNEKTGQLKTALTVDEVRRLQSFFAHHSSYGGWRVAVVDAADDMNRNAANALLKTLEEPPPRAFILLVAHRPARLLPTIRSRCRKLTLKPLADEDLDRVLAAHDVLLEGDDRQAALRLAEGSAGLALMLASGEGLTLYRQLSDLIGALPGLDAKTLHDFAGKVGARGAEAQFDRVVSFLDGWMMRLIRTAATSQTPQDILPGDGSVLAGLAQAQPLAAWIEAWDKIRASCAQGAALNLDRKQLLLTAFFTLQATAKQP